jgi:transposase
VQSKKKSEEALGKSRGGNTTKIHAKTDGLGRCIDFILTEGQVHESTQAKALLEGKNPENVIADKAYDSDEIRSFIKKTGAKVVIPSNGARIPLIKHDEHTYKERCLIENFFQFIKRFRRIATRYEMRKEYYSGMVTLACIIQWLIF